MPRDNRFSNSGTTQAAGRVAAPAPTARCARHSALGTTGDPHAYTAEKRRDLKASVTAGAGVGHITP